MKKIVKQALMVMATASMLLVSFSVYAYTIDPEDIDEILWQAGDPLNVGFDPSQLAASIKLQGVDSDTFTMKVYNETVLTQASDSFDFPATISLTSVGFNLGDFKIVSGAAVGPDSTNTLLNVSNVWGFDNEELNSGYFLPAPEGITTKSVDTVVSTMEAAVEAGGAFSTTETYDPSHGIDGPKDGVLPEGIFRKNYLTDYVLITLNISRDDGSPFSILDWDSFFAGIDRQDVVVGFGSPTAPIPEPATMLLFGTGLVGLASVARRKSKK